jgi:hypothetical protein
MWQRFTERARRVIFFSQDEAGRLGENYVSTEHILLGLTRETDTVAARILDTLGVKLDQIRFEIERQVARADGAPATDMQLTPRAKRVIDLAYDEARQLDNNYIGTEHLLLGLVREENGLAGRVLLKLGVTLTRTRNEVAMLQAARDNEKDEAAAASQAAVVVASPEMGAGKFAPPQSLGFRKAHLAHLLRRAIASEPELASLPGDEILARLSGDPMAPLPPDSHAERALAPGDLGTAMAPEGRANAEFAPTADTFLDLIAACRARDAYGYAELLASQKNEPLNRAAVLALPTGTPLKVLTPPRDAPTDAIQGGYYVRALGSGDLAGRAGWVLRDRFAYTGPDDAPFPPAEGE